MRNIIIDNEDKGNQQFVWMICEMGGIICKEVFCEKEAQNNDKIFEAYLFKLYLFIWIFISSNIQLMIYNR